MAGKQELIFSMILFRASANAHVIAIGNSQHVDRSSHESTPSGPYESVGAGRCQAGVSIPFPALCHSLPYFFFLARLSPSNSLKTASPTKQEQARLEVENAEDDLVQKTEVAITLMKTVLDNVRLFSWAPYFPDIRLLSMYKSINAHSRNQSRT